MYQEIDLVLRLILMAFFILFMSNSITNYINAREDGLVVASHYYLAFSIFFFLSWLNYVQAEINIQYGIYPDTTWNVSLYVIPIKIPEVLFNTMTFILFFIPSVIPLIYVIEKHFQKWDVPFVTIVGIVCFILTLLIFIVPPIASICIVIVFIGIAIMMTLFVSLYIKMAIKSSGLLRKSSILMIIGWALQLVALLFPISENSLVQPIIAHTIAIIGTTFLYYGMKTSNE